MADETNTSIFTEKAENKLRSPDDLDDYVRVTNPSVWVVLAACISLVIGLLVWGILGSVYTSVAATGVVVNDKAMCFLSADDVAKVDEGDVATVDGVQMKVADVASIPMSRDEADDVLPSDYLASTLIAGDWVYQVTFDGDISQLDRGVPLTVSIVVERIAPISLIFGNGS